MKDKTTTTTTTTTRVDVRKAFAEGLMTPDEERVIRMRHGIGERSETKLEQKVMPTDEARAKLAMIEKMAMDTIMGRSEQPVVETANPRKDHIIGRLRRAKKSDR